MVRGEEGIEDCLKEDEENSQRTYEKDPWTLTMVWGLTMEERRAGWKGAKGEKKMGQL